MTYFNVGRMVTRSDGVERVTIGVAFDNANAAGISAELNRLAKQQFVPRTPPAHVCLDPECRSDTCVDWHTAEALRRQDFEERGIR